MTGGKMADELILVVDDEANIIQLTRLYLTREGFQVEAAVDGRAALEAVERLHPSLMVLDLMLPEIDGLEVCRRLRAQNNPIPILMLTARDEDIDKILGLEFGADDYLTKPFNPRELVARIKAILRRGGMESVEPIAALRVGDLVIDPARHEVTINGEQINLRAKEFDLLLTLIQHKSLVLSRDQLLDLAWGYEFYGQTRTVDVHIAHLRKKLASSSVQIKTVTGVGYKLIASG
jgi:DNA-binding response OmpR family regulator